MNTRYRDIPEYQLTYGDLRLCLVTQEVDYLGEPIRTQPRQRNVLAFLLLNQGRVITHQEIFDACFKQFPEQIFDLNLVLVNIYRIRKAFAQLSCPIEIKRVKKIGYILQ